MSEYTSVHPRGARSYAGTARAKTGGQLRHCQPMGRRRKQAAAHCDAVYSRARGRGGGRSCHRRRGDCRRTPRCGAYARVVSAVDRRWNRCSGRRAPFAAEGYTKFRTTCSLLFLATLRRSTTRSPGWPKNIATVRPAEIAEADLVATDSMCRRSLDGPRERREVVEWPKGRSRGTSEST